MRKTLKQLADYVGGKVVGDENTIIETVMGIEEATEGAITFVSNPKYEGRVRDTKASAIIVSPKLLRQSHESQVNKPLLVSDNPYLAFAKIVALMMEKKLPPPLGIDPTAKVSPTAFIGKDVSIQEHVHVGDNVTIGNRVVLYPGVYIGNGCKIGDDTVIHPNAVIYHHSVIGERVILHSNVVIGSEGFGWAPDGKGAYVKIPQVGIAVIEDDVSIGANTTINRATLGKTIVKRGTKIDSQVVISHNVEVGENCLFVSQVGVSGSVKIGKNVTLAGQVGLVGHIEIGDNVAIGAQSGVTRDLPPNRTYLGSPAYPIEETKKSMIMTRNLPDMRKKLKTLEKKVAELETKLEMIDGRENRD